MSPSNSKGLVLGSDVEDYEASAVAGENPAGLELPRLLPLLNLAADLGAKAADVRWVDDRLERGEAHVESPQGSPRIVPSRGDW